MRQVAAAEAGISLVNESRQQSNGPHLWRLAVGDQYAPVSLALARPSDDDGLLTPEECSIAQSFKGARRDAFVTGRALARVAMVQVGVATGSVLRSADGAPVWGSECVGSLSHSRKWVAAVVARSSVHRGLGIDIEQRGRVREHLFRRVLTVRERDQLIEMPEAGHSERATWIFSAKEALYKAVFPTLRRYIGFEAVEVQFTSAPCPDTHPHSAIAVVAALDGLARVEDAGQVAFQYVGPDLDCRLIDSAAGRVLLFEDQVIVLVVLPFGNRHER